MMMYLKVGLFFKKESDFYTQKIGQTTTTTPMVPWYYRLRFGFY